MDEFGEADLATDKYSQLPSRLSALNHNSSKPLGRVEESKNRGDLGKEIGKRGAKLEKSDVTEADITLSGGANKRVVAICLTVVMAAVVGVSLFIYRTDFPTSQRIAAEAAPGVEETVPEADNERTADAGIITFGSGSKAFNMEFVAIGNPGNAADTPSDPNPAAGKVDYPYQMGKFEVSEDMITKSNASQSLQITKDTRGVDKPATSVSWN